MCLVLNQYILHDDYESDELLQSKTGSHWNTMSDLLTQVLELFFTSSLSFLHLPDSLFHVDDQGHWLTVPDLHTWRYSGPGRIVLPQEHTVISVSRIVSIRIEIFKF